ncbi:MAG: 2OG-Fe(II) oxygenase [Methylococcales bacterium]|nr:2OG-Fe(II) oxygenase [Methylococcales bacterium]
MKSVGDQLFDILKTVQRPGDFYATGSLDIFLPQLEVAGVGRIALPLLPTQAERLLTVAEQAPYGRGQETLVDTDVRRTWQIDARQVSLKGKHWPDNLHTIVRRCAEGLGVSGEVQAELYKMLVYDAGSFFVSHRDTEKAPGMFATLVVVLPSAYQGGKLVIRHHQRTVTLDLLRDDAAEIGYAAFYADCVHEVLPVTQGCRLTLIYNLIRADQPLPLPKPPDYQQQQAKVVALLRQWTATLKAENDSGIPEKLIYPLEHAYTSAEMGFGSLKNADAAVADVLVEAATQADCDIHLALVSVEESGSAEYSGGYGRYWDDETDEEDFEIGEVFDRSETLSEWRRKDGTPSPLPILPFSEHEFCPLVAYANIKPDQIEFQEATGNAGASFERSYQVAALVVWPKALNLAIINQAGPVASLPMLRDFCQQWEQGGQDQQASLWQEAHTLAVYMLRDLFSPNTDHLYHYQSQNSDRGFLECLIRLRDSHCVTGYWQGIAGRGFYQKEDCAALVQTAFLVPRPTVVRTLEQAFLLSAATAQEACAALLAGLCVAQPDRAQDFQNAAQILLAALRGDPQRMSERQAWQCPTTANPELVSDVLASFSAINAALADTALTYFLAWPVVYDMDKVLVAAALSLTEAEGSRHLPVVVQLRTAVMAHIHLRVAMTLQPPADWRRDSQISCTCPDCTALRLFLGDPVQPTWYLKAAEARRKHVEHIIQKHQSDVTISTERIGSPHKLVCTKNKASYQRRVVQRRNDLAMLASLTCTTASP